MVAKALQHHSVWVQCRKVSGTSMMNKIFDLPILVIAMLAAAPPAEARRDDQGSAREDMQAGKVMKLREIEGLVVPQMRGMQYLGPEYDSTAQVYRLKFINKDRVVFVDVDGRTGSVLRQR
jgi:hypothetical protein